MNTQINDILCKWDPINIGLPLSRFEYKKYISKIKENLGDRNKITKCLLEIINDLGLDYNPDDKNQKFDLNKITNQLIVLQYKEK